MPNQPDLKTNPLINSQTANALSQGNELLAKYLDGSVCVAESLMLLTLRLQGPRFKAHWNRRQNLVYISTFHYHPSIDSL